MERSVWATTEFIGFHRWVDAPEEVKYLRSYHRHKFLVRVEVLVVHNERDVEFHTLKDAVNKVIRHVLGLGSPSGVDLSCESMAERIGEVLNGKKFNVKQVDVSEDGECGSTIRF